MRSDCGALAGALNPHSPAATRADDPWRAAAVPPAFSKALPS
jgi:hypothetical protein